MYDQRGKLIDGDDTKAREVMEYVVFERQITKPFCSSDEDFVAEV